MIQALGAPTAEASKAFKALGVDVGQNAIEQKGLVGVLKDVYNASGGNMEIMRKFIPEVTALSAVQALATTQTERYSQNLDGLANSFGSTEKALQLYTDSEEFKLQQSQMIWDNWKLGVGESTVGVMASLIELGGFFSKWLNMLSKLI